MREKSKLEKWIERYLNVKKLGIVESSKSRYYKFNTRILRVSDHISNGSDGDLSIILDYHDDLHYLIHAVRSGEITILTLEETKRLLKSIALLPAIMQVANSKDDCSLPKTLVPEPNSNCDMNDKLVLGIPIGKFKSGQQQAIYGMVKKLKK